MQATNSMKNKYLYEYVFARIIQDHNIEYPDNLIRTSEAREFNKRVKAALDQLTNSKGEQYTFENCPMDLYKDVVSNVLKPRTGYDYFGENKDVFDVYVKDYLGVTGFKKASDNFEFSGAHVPISPYDEDYANRAVMLNVGSNILYVSQDQVVSLNGLSSPLIGESIDMLRLKESSSGAVNYVSIGEKLMSPDDYSGLSMLMPYMKEREYEAVKEWVNAPHKIPYENATAQERTEMFKKREQNIEKAVTILRGLRELGFDYDIKKDEHPGQIEAALAGTRVKVRIMEPPGQEAYIGRVYDDGVQVYYSTTLRVGTNVARYDNPTAEEALNLVKFAINAPINHRDMKSLEDNTYHIKMQGKPVAYNAFTYLDKAVTCVTGDLIDDKGVKNKYGHKVLIRYDTAVRGSKYKIFADQEMSDDYIKNAIDSAKSNFEQMCDVDVLIDLAQKKLQGETVEPNFSGDMLVNTLQRSYWDVLTGVSDTLMKPTEDVDFYNKHVGEVGSFRTDNEFDKLEYDMFFKNMVYDGSPEEKVKSHMADNLNYLFGQYEKDDEGKRFNPFNVVKYFSSGEGVFRNEVNMVRAISASNIDADELKGTEYQNKSLKMKLIKFDEKSAQVMKNIEHPFVQEMYKEIKNALERSGVELKPDDILFDENGIVKYTGSIRTRQRKDLASVREINGYIGQIFVPNELGAIKTKFNGIDNYYCVPGYEAYIVPQRPGENKSVVERTRLKGYSQLMSDQIRYQIRNDLLLHKSSSCGSTFSLNKVYRSLYDERHPLNYEEEYLEQGLDEEMIKALFETQASRVRYSNDVKQESTVHADYAYKHFNGVDFASDNKGDIFVLTGGKNMCILDETFDGYFDKIATSTGTNQGITRYLVKGSKVNLDGSITPSEDKNARTPLLDLDFTRYMEYNPADRQQMGFGSLLSASAVAKKANVALLTVQGLTQDDSMLVSKKFADTYKMRDDNGVLRSLVIGDKISDLHGNKGVISHVIDPDMSDEDAREQGILKTVQLFRDNPDLDVAMAPFSAVSRFNGGSARELMSNSKPLYIDDKEISGGIGEISMVITDKSADSKTKIYDDVAISRGKGRKVSAQLAWSLQAQDCKNVMKEVFSYNTSALSNLREYLIVLGLDINEVGDMQSGYSPHQNEERTVMPFPEVKVKENGSLDIVACRNDYRSKIPSMGGFIELPFPITLHSGKKTVPNERGFYEMPLLSSFLRSEHVTEDDSNFAHEYTHFYALMIEDGLAYQHALNQLKTETDPEKIEKYQKTLQNSSSRCQTIYKSMAYDIEHRKFEGKHNIFRDTVMASRMPNSATAIWTADPTLGIDEVSVGSALWESLGLKEGDYIMIWRDPALRDGCCRYLRAVENPDITGISVNPAIDKSFDGDYDGDSIGVLALKTKGAILEAKEKLSMASNLLDYGSKNENGLYNLYMHNSLDTKVACYYHPELQEKWDKITKEVNAFEEKYASGKIQKNTVMRYREKAVNDLNDFYKDAFDKSFGEAVIQFDSAENHLKSIYDSCILTGAKGSMSNLQGYLKYFGAKCELNKDGTNFDYDTLVDTKHTLSTRADLKDVQYATAVKSFGTGLAGAVSQRGVKALREYCQKAVLEMTYPVTQSILQIKRSPDEARHKYDMLMTNVKPLWNGHVLEKKDDGTWSVAKSMGKASQKEWADSFYDFYTSKEGLNVSINRAYVDEIAHAMADQNGFIKGVDEMGASAHLLDTMAYGGTFRDLVKAADANKNLFEGDFASQFAPNIIKKNKVQLDQFTPDEEVALKKFAKSDSQKDKSRVLGKKVSVRTPAVLDPEVVCNDIQDDSGFDY